MSSNFMPMGYRTNNGYLVSDQTVQALKKFFQNEIEIEVSPADILCIVDVFKKLQEEKTI
jgi:hypothetical protein